MQKANTYLQSISSQGYLKIADFCTQHKSKRPIFHAFCGKTICRDSLPVNLDKLLKIAEQCQMINDTNPTPHNKQQALSVSLLKQVHSNRVVHVGSKYDKQSNFIEIEEGDALITDIPRRLLAVKTADCVPILLHEQNSGYIAAIHAGWRGALSGIIHNTVKKLHDIVGKCNIEAAIGPCIQQASYEVSHDFYQECLTKDSKSDTFFATKHRNNAKAEDIGQMQYYFNLPAYCISCLRDMSISTIHQAKIDTYSNPDALFSHRYILRNNLLTGRQISVIGIT